MIIITIAPKQSRFFMFLLRKSLPGTSLVITDPYELTMQSIPASALLHDFRIDDPIERKTTYTISLVVNPPDKVTP